MKNGGGMTQWSLGNVNFMTKNWTSSLENLDVDICCLQAINGITNLTNFGSDL